MPWRYTEEGNEMQRPTRDGVHVDGPLTARDVEHLIEELERLRSELKREETDEWIA